MRRRQECLRLIRRLAYWSTRLIPQPAFLATHWVSNLGPEIFFNPDVYRSLMYGCSAGTFIGDGDKAVAACAWASGIGGAPKAGVTIDSMSLFTSKGMAPAGYTGGELTVYP